MMKFFLQLIVINIIIILLSSCKKKADFNIICYIEGIKNDSALIAFIPQSNRDKEIIDTVRFHNNKLEYNFPVHELHESFIIPYKLIYKFENGNSYPLPASRINFFIDSLEKVSLEGIVNDKIVDYEIRGNLLSEQLSVARKMKLSLFEERVDFEHAYNSKRTDKMDENTYDKLRIKNDHKYQQQIISYVKKHPDDEYAARQLLEIRDKDMVSKLYNSLTLKVKNSYFGEIVGTMVDAWLLTDIGIHFPNIIDTTIDGQKFELKNYRGKYVLLDFWGSWCKPCLVEIPRMKSIYERISDNFEIVGIACNDNENRLIKTIKSHEINWIQILEGQIKNKDYSTRFGIQSFPTKILLDPAGKVLKTYVGLDESLYTDIEEIL